MKKVEIYQSVENRENKGQFENETKSKLSKDMMKQNRKLDLILKNS